MSSFQIKLFTCLIVSSVLFCPGWGFPSQYQEEEGGDFSGDNEEYPDLRQIRSEASKTHDPTSVANLVRLTERYLTKFDMTLAIQIKPYVEKLKGPEKRQFLSDIEEMNELIEEEILKEMVQAAEKDKADGGDEEELSRRVLSSYGDVAKNAIVKVVSQYKKKPWMQRIMDFAGNEIENSVRKM